MYVILVYDIEESRVAKILKICRKYLKWVQNSVLEGEISRVSLKKLQLELKRAINEEEDSVIFYILRTTKYMKKEIMGQEKGGFDNIL